MSSLSFNPKKSEHLDKQGQELLQAIVKRPEPPRNKMPDTPPPMPGYLAEKDVIMDLGEIAGPIDFSITDLNGNTIEQFRSFENEKVGYDFIGIKKIYLLVESILKDTLIDEQISADFLFKKIYQWLLTSYEKGGSDEPLSKHLIQKMNEAIKERIVYLPILFLEADREMPMGDVKLMYLKEKYIRELAEKVKEDRRESYIKSMLAHKGQLMARTVVHAESSKAVANAKEKACYVIDILRMLSPTVEEPRLTIYYDVDFRNTNRQGNNIIVQDPNEPENMSLSMDGNAKPFVIDQQLWTILLKMGLPELIEFRRRTQMQVTELNTLILNGMKLFSKALANHDYYERIVFIFSVLESLLLPDESGNIMEAVAKYLPLLITGDIEQRKTVASTVKEMYKVRSSMIHHGKRKDFEIHQLGQIQIYTRALLMQYVRLSIQKTTKREILREIDDKLMSI